MSCLKTKAQSTLEYVILIGVVVAALIAMGIYMKRGAQGQLRQAADQIGEQYSAGLTTSNYLVTSKQTQREVLSNSGRTETQINSEQTRTGNETVKTWESGN